MEFTAKYPQVEWRKIIGMRNVLIHGYDIVRSDVLWDTVKESVPTLLHSNRTNAAGFGEAVATAEAGHSTFGHSFVIRHSSFVI